MDGHRRALSAARAGRAAAIALPAAFLALFFLWPLAAIVERSGPRPGVLAERETLDVLWFTVWQATASTALTLAAGLPAAWAISRRDLPGRRAAAALVVVPFVLPTVVVATAFVALLPPSLDRSAWAILLAHVFFNVAVVVRIVGGYWAALDPRLGEAASTLGAGPWQRLRHVTLPALAPAIAAASAIVFLFCFTSFGIVVILGGPKYRTLEAAIYDQAVRFFDLPTAAALALLQLAAVALVLVVAGRLERRVGTVPASAAEGASSSRRERVAAGAILVVTGALLAIPLAVLVQRSLHTPTGYGLGSFRSLTEETPVLLLAPWRAALNSVLLAACATAIALAVGGLAAVSLARARRRWLDGLILLPLGASAVMLGFGFIVAFDQEPVRWRGSVWLVPVAQALVAAPFVVRVLTPSLRAVDERLREAAAVLGARPSRAWREVELPLVLRAVGIAAGLAFAIALGEFGATVFVAPGDVPTLPVAIFRFLGRPGAENAGTAAALAVVLMLLAAVAVLLTDRPGGARR